MFCYLFYNSLVKPKRKYSLSWIWCESKHDLQKKPMGKPGFFTWAFPWMWSRIKQNKLETLVYLLNWRFSSFSAIWVFRTKYCHIHSLLAAVQLLDEATCSYNLRNYADWRGCYGYSVWHPPRSVQFFKSYERQTFQRILLATYNYIAFCDFCYKSSIVKILIKIKKNHN